MKKIEVAQLNLRDCDSIGVIVDTEYNGEKHIQYHSSYLSSATISPELRMFVDDEEYKRSVMANLKRLMPSLFSVNKTGSTVEAIFRTYVGLKSYDDKILLSCDPAPHRTQYIFYP